MLFRSILNGRASDLKLSNRTRMISKEMKDFISLAMLESKMLVSSESFCVYDYE